MNQSIRGISTTQTASGLEFAHITGGADFRLTKIFGVGPFADLALGQYSSLSVSGLSSAASGDIKDKTLHQWLTLGARFVFFP